jgi:hypothetical protein
MFATIRARAPYDEHLPYSVEGDHFEVLADQPIPPYAQKWFDHQNRGTAMVLDPDELHRRLEAVLGQAQRRYPALAIHGVRLYLTIFEAPAYPAPARFEAHPVAIVGELDQTSAPPIGVADRSGDAGPIARDVFRTALGRFEGDCAVADPVGLDLTGSRWVYYRDDEPAPVDADGGCVGTGDPIIAAAITRDGLPWLVATRASWHWQ